MTAQAAALRSVELEALRYRLEAMAEESAATVLRTSVTPTVTEGLDFSTTILDESGRVLAVGGYVPRHSYASAHAVRCTIEQFGSTIAPGDVFLANDPHTGGGLHPNDVVVQRPIFADGELVAWAALSAHMADMGGMTPGSFAIDARECYGEAIRVPPVRLVRAGETCDDIWRMLLTNIRFPQAVEMDLRSLVAGAHVADERISALASSRGVDEFRVSTRTLIELTEHEFRRRIGELADGVYEVTNWAEWTEELFPLSCTLTIVGDTFHFDFTQVADQAPHFFNSKPYTVQGGIAQSVWALMGHDLPINEGIFTPIVVETRPGSILDCRPPAPIGAGHVHAAQVAWEVGTHCVRLAAAASPGTLAAEMVTGWQADINISPLMWSCVDDSGRPAFFYRPEGAIPGSSAAPGRDGHDLAKSLIGVEIAYGIADLEYLEARQPILFHSFRHRLGQDGAGTWRAGAGAVITYSLHGAEHADGIAWGTRSYLPVPGAAGGMPGGSIDHVITRSDGTAEKIEERRAMRLTRGDVVVTRSATGGGWGDPLDRDPAAVAEDVADGRLTAVDAATAYGVVLDADGSVAVVATESARDAQRRDRLAAARPAAVVVAPTDVERVAAADTHPLAFGIVHRGAVAFAERSGAPLSVAPRLWTDGCAVLERPLDTVGLDLVCRSYLDPLSGTALFTEVAPAIAAVTERSAPAAWAGLG